MEKPKYSFEFWVDISIFDSIVKCFEGGPLKNFYRLPAHEDEI
jgi:hypothetical protein